MKRRFRWPGGALRCVLVTALAVGVVSAAQLAVSPHVDPARADAATGSAGLFVPTQGTVLDTRSGIGGVSGSVPAYTWYPVQVAGLAGVPASGVTSVQVSVTAFNPALSGYLQLAANGTAEVSTSALIYTGGGGSFSASSIVALGPDGKIRVLSQRSVNVLIAVQGYYTAGNGSPAPGGYVPVHPTRLVDTRAGTGLPQAKLAIGSTTSIKAGGLASVPADASAVFVMLTGISNSTVGGTFTPYPTGSPKPANVALSFLPNTATILGAAVDLGTGAQFNLTVGATGAAIDVVVDVVGYYSASSGTGDAFTPASARVYDSRIAPSVEIPGSATRKLPIGGMAGVPLPSTGISAYSLSVQVLHPGPNIGFVAVGPGDQTAAFVSSVYLTPGDGLRSNLVIAQPGPDGTIQVFNHSPDPIDIVLDVEGWYADPGPGLPVVESTAYPEESWTAPGSGLATFTLTDSGTGSPVTHYTYRIDAATPTTVSGSGSTITFTPPTVLGPHTLSVVASDRLGITSPANDYAFNVGSPPSAPTDLALRTGDGSADLTWTAGQDNGAPTHGFMFWIVDRTTVGAPLDLGSCSSCTHFVLTGLDPAHTYAAQVAAASAAGPSTVSTSADFAVAGDPIICSASDEACATQNIGQRANLDPIFANYDLSGTDGDASSGSSDSLTAQTTPATADPQCALAAENRVGSWVCDDPGAATDGESTPAFFGFCWFNGGCWRRADDFNASWSGVVVYGFGRTTLGTASASIEWQLVGGRSTSKPIDWRASGQTRNVMFSAAMFNGAPNVRHGGSPIWSSLDFSRNTPVAGPNTTITWNPNGYSHYNDSMYDHNVVTEFSWEVPGYPGYWYFYVRSLCSHTTRTGRSAIYRFDQLFDGLPGDKEGAGHRS